MSNREIAQNIIREYLGYEEYYDKVPWYFEKLEELIVDALDAKDSEELGGG